jgi:large subunit ribosomal protein L29
MKKKDYFGELKSMSKNDLVDRARTLAEEIMKLRFRRASGQLEKAGQVREIRRNLARVKTVLRAQALSAQETAKV